MKKLTAMILMLALVLAMTACGGEAAEPQAQVEITRATEAPDQGYSLEFQGLKLVPGDAFDAAKLPEAQSVYEVPSCAIEGTDNVYSYGGLEVTAFNDGSGEMIYSLYLMDASVKTDEGLAVGDAEDRITEIYGQEHQGAENEYLYTRGGTELRVLVQDGQVLSIELRKCA